jgi:PatG C-terminal
MCNGLALPVVFVDQVYSFDSESLLAAIPRPESIEKRDFENAAREVFERIRGLADHTGSSDEHRALNYLVVRAPTLYAKTAEQLRGDFSLTAVDTRRSSLSHGRRIVEVVFSYTDRGTGFLEKSFVRVDVTEQFPFLLTNMSPYYDR